MTCNGFFNTDASELACPATHDIVCDANRFVIHHVCVCVCVCMYVCVCVTFPSILSPKQLLSSYLCIYFFYHFPYHYLLLLALLCLCHYRLVRIRGIVMDSRGLPFGHPVAPNRIIANCLLAGTIRYDVIWCDTMLYGSILHYTILYRAAFYYTVLHSTVQCHAVLCPLMHLLFISSFCMSCSYSLSPHNPSFLPLHSLPFPLFSSLSYLLTPLFPPLSTPLPPSRYISCASWQHCAWLKTLHTRHSRHSKEARSYY